ncbi:MAG: hypothetical protein SWE60_14120 [Thermodesulfobacteriota bacterium]|nr:hypothetical protein [Thermodesulfobacteriota bacterium]
MIDIVEIVCLFLLSFVLSTFLIRKGIPLLHDEGKPVDTTEDKRSDQGADSGPTLGLDWRSTGLWIGFCETLLVFVLVFHGEYSALTIIFAAKEFVRKEKIQDNPSYYLLGTLINVSVAVLSAILAREMATF